MTMHPDIGRYRIEAAIGEGAMAHVYLGHDPSIDRSVAIKVLKPEFRADAEVVHRFIAESRAAGMLSHSHIVTIYDVGEADGAPYIAMEHLQGRPLDEILRDEGRMTVERMVGLGHQIADALAYAHARGVIHRDVKPSNILIVDGGRTAKLLDFGIARIDARDCARGEQDALRTQAGQVMGTPRYMSPEQAMGLAIDARSDLFSLGAVFYEMITGKPAFPGTGLATLAIQIAQQDPEPIDSQVRECPRGLRFIIGKMLSKKPAERFIDANALMNALERERTAMTQENHIHRRGMALRLKLPLTLAVTAAVSLLLSVGLVLDREKAIMTDMAITSGMSITDFVAGNAALRIADNAGLSAAEQDWLPLQAFVEQAAKDRNVKSLVILDDGGVIRAAGQKTLIGSRYRAPTPGGATMTADGIRFVRAIRYAGANFGMVDLTMDRTSLDSGMARARFLLMGLSLFVIAVVAGIGYLSARQVSAPLRRLRVAIDEASEGNCAFRLSHTRNDEFGRLFDAFNGLMSEMESRAPKGPAADMQALLRTRISSRDQSGNREAA